MAVVMDQQQQPYKHYCRICKKGFGCGRALGGHMRAHGINDDPIGDHPDDDPLAGNKRMYALRTNPNRPKSCRVCENCGEEFLSWKSFLEHGRCRSDDDSPPSSPRSDGGDEDAGGGQNLGCSGWSKGKRTRRRTNPTPVSPSSEEEDLANCLVMLSSAHVEPMVVVETEESCASASKEEDRRHPIYRAAEKAKAPAPAVPRGMFECKACKKVFNSHQALGGHRASHKKVKGCFAAKLEDLDEPPPEEEAIDMAAEMALAIVPFDNPPLSIAPLKKRSKVHECSICHRVFASGQALGGHKRCHWLTSSSSDPSAMAKLHSMPDHHHHHHLTLRPMFEPSEPLDLNLPAPIDVGSPLRLKVPVATYLQSWDDQINNNKKNNTTTSINNSNNGTPNADVDDEGNSKIKLAKLSELNDMNMGGDAAPWLQVGIGSSANEGSDP